MFELKVKGETLTFESFYDAVEYCKRAGIKNFKITKQKFK